MVPKNIENTIIILGPTGVGKTNFAHRFADELRNQGKEVAFLSLDPFQTYQGWNIGTAKPTPKEQEEYSYKNIDLFDASQTLDAAKFAKICDDLRTQYLDDRKTIICVGGSGLYTRAFLHGLDNSPTRDEKIRSEIRQKADQNGWKWCHQWLQSLDSKRASQIHENDKTRIERALEICLLSQRNPSKINSKDAVLKAQKLRFPCSIIFVTCPKDQLKQQIFQRVTTMFEHGWIAEVEEIYEKFGEKCRDFSAMKAIGYLDILDYLLSENSSRKEQLINKIQTKTWQYAKRQMTWFAKEKKHFIWDWENEQLKPVSDTE